MRIVFFVHRYWPAVGGVEKYVHELAKALLGKGHEVVVVAGSTADDFADRDNHEGVAIRRFPAHRSPLRARWWLHRHAGLFRWADVIQVGNTHMLEYFWRCLGTSVDRRKVFLTRHGMSYIHPVPDWEKRRAVRSLELAAGVVHDGAYIEKWLGVPADVCPDQGLAPLAEALPRDPEPPPTSAVYIGRIESDSGIRVYLDAVRILTVQEGRDFSFDVFGDGTLAPELRRRAEAERLPVRFHGRVPGAQSRFATACFAFVDGRMAIQEAMARRRLVLAAYVNPLKRDYVCGESFSPYLIATDSASELARQVLAYADNADARRVAVERAFAFARTLSWDRTADAFLELWGSRAAQPSPESAGPRIATLVEELRGESRRPKDEWAEGWPRGVPVATISEPAIA
jgi:glycosyltransferase involved in cell wall biosynthesis